MSETRYERTLTEKVRLSTSVIGVGFAGSFNAQAAFNKLQIPAFVINSSVKDLSDSVINKDIPSFIIGGDGRGAGNDRMKSKEMFKANGRKLLEENEVFVKMVSESDICFVIFSSAGGTGSGTGPDLVKLLRKIYPKKQILPIVIAPKTIDSSLSQYNNLECINELDALEGPYIIGDLDRFMEESEDVAYEKMSEWVLECIRKYSGMDMESSSSGMMDENDLSVVIGADGYMAQYTIEVNAKALENVDIQDLLIQKMSSSPAMLIQKDHKVAWGGLVVNLPDDINDPIKTGNFQKLLNIIGEPKHMYKNYSVSKSPKGTVTLIVSGLSLPYNRLSECTAKVKAYLKATQESQRSISLSADIAELSSVDTDIAFSGFGSTNNMSDGAAAMDDYFD